MTIVEVVDTHGGFSIITDKITTNKKVINVDIEYNHILFSTGTR